MKIFSECSPLLFLEGRGDNYRTWQMIVLKYYTIIIFKYVEQNCAQHEFSPSSFQAPSTW